MLVKAITFDLQIYSEMAAYELSYDLDEAIKQRPNISLKNIEALRAQIPTDGPIPKTLTDKQVISVTFTQRAVWLMLSLDISVGVVRRCLRWKRGNGPKGCERVL